MNAHQPQTLARPLAARVAALPDPSDSATTPNPPAAALPTAVIDRAVQAMHDGHTHYTDRPGILPLRTLAVEQLGAQYGIELSPDEVTITCGATEARFVTLKQLAKPGTTVLCAGEPTAIASAAALLEINVTAAQDSPTLPDSVSILYLTPTDDRASVERLLEAAAQQGWWIIYDVSAGITGEFHPAQNGALAPKTITIGSLSPQLPGWRVGWMAGSQMANKLRAFKQSMTICTTSISQWAALGLGLQEQEG